MSSLRRAIVLYWRLASTGEVTLYQIKGKGFATVLLYAGSKPKWLPLELELSRTRREREKGADRGDGADLEVDRRGDRRGPRYTNGSTRGRPRSAQSRPRGYKGSDAEYTSKYPVRIFKRHLTKTFKIIVWLINDHTETSYTQSHICGTKKRTPCGVQKYLFLYFTPI